MTPFLSSFSPKGNVMRIEPIATGNYATVSPVGDAHSVATMPKRGGPDISNLMTIDSAERLQSLVRTLSTQLLCFSGKRP